MKSYNRNIIKQPLLLTQMKKLLFLLSLAFLMCSSDAYAQFKDLDKRIEDKVKRKLDQKADRTIDKTLNKGEKEIDDEVNEAIKGEKSAKKDKNESGELIAESEESEDPIATNGTGVSKSDEKASFKAYTKFDFIPGESIIFYDDFSADNQGDFPAKWNTNGSGETVITDDKDKLFELKGSSVYLPLFDKALPENYTIEFDFITSELDNKVSSQGFLEIELDDNEGFNSGKDFVRVKLPFLQYGAGKISVRNRVAGKEVINNNLPADIRTKMQNGAHISISVNKKRYRLWLDEEKLVDIPMLVPPNIRKIKLSMAGFTRDFEDYHYYIDNIKIAEGSTDLRSKLIKEGKFTTNGILFDVNSDKIKPASHGVLKEIAQVLKENESVKIKIIGHTDADGDEKSNLDLSKRRAASVKSALSSEFGIAENRIETDGKGESDPSDSSNTPEGKANNRRVEFVKF